MGILDTYTPTRAFWNRKLNDAYTGDCVRVRRGTDDVEQDIGFDADGNIDMTALNTFLGGAAGYVTTFYSQVGGTNALAFSVARQPRIDLETKDGLALISVLADDDSSLYVDDVNEARTYSNYVGVKHDNTPPSGGAPILAAYNTTINRMTLRLSPINSGADYIVEITGTTTGITTGPQTISDPTKPVVYSAIVDEITAGTGSIYRDGTVLIADAPISSASGTGATMGGWENTGVQNKDYHFEGFLQYLGEVHNDAKREEIEAQLRDIQLQTTPMTLNGVAQEGVLVDIEVYDDYTRSSGYELITTVVTDVNGVATFSKNNIPTGKKVFIVPHYNDAGTTSSAQPKFISDDF